MAIFKPSNSNKYHYRFMVNGRICTGSTRTSNKAQACAFERKIKEEKYNETYLDQQSIKQMQLGKLIEAYLKEIKHEKEYKNHYLYCKKLVGVKTDRNTKKQVKIFGFDRTVTFDKLNDGDLMRLVQHRKKEGNGASAILYELVVLSALIKYAKRNKYEIPTVDIAQIKSDAKLKPTKGRIRYLTLDEEQRLLVELQRTDLTGTATTDSQRNDTYEFVVLLLDLGCRHTELSSLKWKDVDLNNRSVRLYRSKVNNESTLLLTDRALEVLKRRHGDQVDHVYVFQREDGNHRGYAPKAFKTACHRAGIEDVSYHTIRHTFCSRMVQAGVPLYAVQQIVGHSTPVMTQRYAHLAPAQASQVAVQVLNSLQAATVSKPLSEAGIG